MTTSTTTTTGRPTSSNNDDDDDDDDGRPTSSHNVVELGRKAGGGVLPPPGLQVRVAFFSQRVALIRPLWLEDDMAPDEDDEDNTRSLGRGQHSLTRTLSTSVLAQWPSRSVDDDSAVIGCGDVPHDIADVHATSFDMCPTSVMLITRLTADHR
jgi:hypothetical protein